MSKKWPYRFVLGGIILLLGLALGIHSHTRKGVAFLFYGQSYDQDCIIAEFSLNKEKVMQQLNSCESGGIFALPAMGGFGSDSYTSLDSLYINLYDLDCELITRKAEPIDFLFKKCITIEFYPKVNYNIEVTSQFTCDKLDI